MLKKYWTESISFFYTFVSMHLLGKILFCTLFLTPLFFISQNNKLDSLQTALANSKSDSTYLSTLNELGKFFVSRETDSTIYYSNKVINKFNEFKNKYAKNSKEFRSMSISLGTAYNRLGLIHYNLAQYPKAIEYYNKSLTIREESKDYKGVGVTCNNLGNLFRDMGEPVRALEYYNRSLKTREQLKDKLGISTVLNDRGIVYSKQGDIIKALENWHLALKIKEEIKDKNGATSVLSNLGNIHFSQKNFETAIDYYTKAINLSEELGSKKNSAYILNNLGITYRELKDLKKSSEYLFKSLKISEEIGDNYGIALAASNIGLNEGDLKNYSTALIFFKKGLKIRQEIEDKEGVSDTYVNIGLLYSSQKNYDLAIECLEKSLRIGEEIGYPHVIVNAAKALSEVYKASNNYKMAMENYKLYIQMRDSINNIETQTASIKQQSRYEYEKQKVIDDEKNASELKVKEEKRKDDRKRQNVIIASVSIILVLLAIFALVLYNRFKTTQKQKQIIEEKEKETQEQKQMIEVKQKEILDSINYAKRIQYTLLAHEQFLGENLSRHFIFFNPKDIVSGDFYWATKKENKFYLAVCDSTGHGVPGAFMSLLNIGFLSEAINEKGISEPNKIFDFVRQKLTESISKEGQKDGFDGILLCIDSEKNIISYAAANNSPILIQNNQLHELPADRMPVGVGEKKENFTLHTINTNCGDMIYLYTDGYPDQFGGPKGKKIKYKALNELLLTNSTSSIDQQYGVLKSTFYAWKGDLEQVDDVCIIGVRI